MVNSYIEGNLISKDITISFIKDVTPHARGLIAIPLLVLADNVIEPMLSRVLKYLQTSGVVPDSEQGCLSSEAERMAHLMNSKIMQVLFVLLAIVVSWFLQSDYVDMLASGGITSWVLHSDNGVIDETWAGTWFLLVTSPLITFLMYRWVWRFIVWSIFLLRVSRMKLELYASHTDLSGGLGVIGL